MLIMPSIKMIFVHLPKCGGTSVEHAFDTKCKWNDIVVGGTEYGEILQPHYLKRYGLEKHSLPKQIIRVIGKGTWDEYFSWATVRNPFTRMISTYSYARMIAAQNLPAVEADLSDTQKIAQWARSAKFPKNADWPWGHLAIQAYLETIDEEYPFSAFLRHPAFMQNHWNWTQKMQLENEDGKTLAIKRFIKLEELARDWPILCQELGTPDLGLPWENSSEKYKERVAPSRSKWRECDVALIQERFCVDFKTFGYDELPPV